MMSRPLCFANSETTSLRPDREAWDVALIRRDPDIGQMEIQFFVDVDLSNADPVSLKVGGFYQRHPYGRWLSSRTPDSYNELSNESEFLHRPRDAAEIIARFTHGAKMVGAVPDFETHTFDRLLRSNELIPAWHYQLADIETMAVGWLRGVAFATVTAPGVELDGKWKSDDLSLACGVEPPGEGERHTAIGDTRWVMRWYDTLMGVQTPSSESVDMWDVRRMPRV